MLKLKESCNVCLVKRKNGKAVVNQFEKDILELKKESVFEITKKKRILHNFNYSSKGKR